MPDYAVLRDQSLVQFIPELAAMADRAHAGQSHEVIEAFLTYVDALRDWSTGSCYPGLDAAFAAISVPPVDADSDTWNAFVDQFRHLTACIDQEIGWEISEEQAERINNYFYAINLLEACLDVAYAPNRNAIRESLLLPPGEWKPDEPKNDWGL
jgi:hypothetical protein